MKTTLELLNEVVAMGFEREYALEIIDASFDEIFGFENREGLSPSEEKITDELYEDALFGFKCESEGINGEL